MRLRLLCAVIGCAAFAQTIGQPDQKHFSAHTPTAALSFAADSIERQDSQVSPKGFASVVQLRGNVHIRTCCVQAPDWSKNKSPTPPKLVVLVQADEVDFNQATGEMDVRGAVHVNFQNYPNQNTTDKPPRQ